MGVYGVGVPQGGSLSYVRLYSQFPGTTTEKWDVAYDDADGITPAIPTGTSCYTSWIMTGTLSDVEWYMFEIYSGQINGSIPRAIPSQSCPNAQ